MDLKSSWKGLQISVDVNAEQFIEKLETYRSPGKAGSDEHLGVRMGQVFALAKEFMDMPPAVEHLDKTQKQHYLSMKSKPNKS